MQFLNFGLFFFSWSQDLHRISLRQNSKWFLTGVCACMRAQLCQLFATPWCLSLTDRAAQVHPEYHRAQPSPFTTHG